MSGGTYTTTSRKQRRATSTSTSQWIDTNPCRSHRTWLFPESQLMTERTSRSTEPPLSWFKCWGYHKAVPYALPLTVTTPGGKTFPSPGCWQVGSLSFMEQPLSTTLSCSPATWWCIWSKNISWLIYPPSLQKISLTITRRLEESKNRKSVHDTTSALSQQPTIFRSEDFVSVKKSLYLLVPLPSMDLFQVLVQTLLVTA